MPVRKERTAYHGDGGGPRMVSEQLGRRLDHPDTKSQIKKQEPLRYLLTAADGVVLGAFATNAALRAAQIGLVRT